MEFEALRGLMAWLVVASHVLAIAGYADRPLPRVLQFFRNGGLGVEVFVMLSGFVIFHLLLSKKETYRVFLFRRAARLYPAYLLALAAGIWVSSFAGALLGQLPWSSGKVITVIAGNLAASRQFFWQHLFLHLTMLHGLFPNEVLPFSSSAFLDVAWSVSLEWQFYIVAPLLAALLLHRKWGFLLLAILAALAVRIQPYFGDFTTPGRVLTWHLKGFLPLMFQFFAIGIASYFLFVRLARARIQLPRFTPALVACGAYVIHIPLSITIWLTVLSVAIANIGGSRDIMTDVISRLLLSGPLQLLGRISYSTYLFHLPVIFSVAWILVRLDLHRDPAVFALALAIGAVPLTLLLSLASYRLVERPSINWAARVSKGWTDCRTAAAVPDPLSAPALSCPPAEETLQGRILTG